MSNYLKVEKVLRNAEEPLTGKQVAERCDVRENVVYSLLKRMAEKNKVFRDENFECNYSVMYQLRQRHVRSSNKNA